MSNAESRTFAWKRVDGFRVEIREGERRVLRRVTTRPVISNPDVAGTRRAWGRTRWWPGNGGDGDGRRGVMVVVKPLLLAVETGVVVVGFTRG